MKKISNNLLNQYIKYFGKDATIPPEHIMKTLVEMKEKGTYDSNMKVIKKEFKSIKKKIEEKTGTKLDKDNPIFDVDFDKSEN